MPRSLTISKLLFIEMNLILSLIAVAVSVELVICEPELELTNGVIRGKILKSRDRRSYYSYTGIPYAKPPIGKLRFQAPKPAEPWKGKLDATKESNICIQQGSMDGDEDCLYLNVYYPKTDNKSLPVMFWIHGGGFTWGHSRSDLYGPDYFMDKDVVLVTINYRLGILGFMSTGDDVLPGNYGMKDQVEALRWVQKNIIKFSGNPNQVTIFGGSSGASSVGYHMLSPMSKGLFHKAILQSGAPVCNWAILPPGLPRKRAHAAATVAGCNFNTSDDILKCFRKLPARYLMDIHTKLFAWFMFPAIMFNPVVENCNSGREAFLCNNPIQNFKQESFVPAILGLNSGEGGLYVARLYNKTSLAHTEFRTYFNRLFSIAADYSPYTKPEYIDEIGVQVLNRYFPPGGMIDGTHLNAVKMFTDFLFSNCVINMTYQLSSPVYSYLFNYQNEFSYNKVFGPCEEDLGVAHGDELNGLFKMSSLNSNDLNANDLQVSKLMINIWYKFISSNEPTVDGSDNGLVWPKFTQSNQLMLNLNSSNPSLIQNPFTDDYDFWSKLPIYSKQNKQ